jgi:tetratricopeptide (TPR) repeat protein
MCFEQHVTTSGHWRKEPASNRMRWLPTVFQKVTSNSYGIYDGLIISLDAALGRQGRATLRGLLLQQRQQYLTQDKLATIAAGRYDFTLSCLSLALRDIAESEGDADAFIDSYQGSDLANPRFASEIALQLLRSGRAEEALTYLERASPSTQNPHFGQTEWTNARIAVLDALQRVDEAQVLRLAFFQAQLSPSHLRAYLDRLPDFDDVAAEDRALDVVAGHSNVHAALAFLVAWPAHARAARLVCLRIREIDGDRYELLDPAARALEGKHPLAAVLLRRALIEVTLQKGRATRYKHAARHVREIASLNAQVKDYAGFETHDQFMARLLRTHPRKTGFWPLLRD